MNGLLVAPTATTAALAARDRAARAPTSSSRGASARARSRSSAPWVSTPERVRRPRARVVDAVRSRDGRPRLLLVARTRYELPLSPSLERKFAALARAVRAARARDRGRTAAPRTTASSASCRGCRSLDGPLFYALLPLRVRRLAREHRPDAIVTQSPYEAACVWLARTGAKVIVELHGDWRTATRLYGSPLRRALSPVADAVGAFGLRRADAVRTVSTYTSGLVRELGVEPAREFAAFMDLELFLEPRRRRCPSAPAALFVGVLELYKNVDGLARAWRLAAPRAARTRSLRIVGRGTRRDVVEALVRDLPGADDVDGAPRRRPRSRAALDEATCLVLPSRSEGLGRVLVEAFLRGRAGGRDGHRRHPRRRRGRRQRPARRQTDEELADALVRVLTDRDLAERLARRRARRAASAGSRRPERVRRPPRRARSGHAVH